MRIAAIVLVVSLWGCGDSDAQREMKRVNHISRVVTTIEGYAEKACACTTAACAAEVERFFTAFVSDPDNAVKGSAADTQRVQDATSRMTTCVSAVQTAQR